MYDTHDSMKLPTYPSPTQHCHGSLRAKCWVTGRQFILKNLIQMTLCFVDLIGTAPSPVANNIAAVDPGAGGGLLVDVFDMPAVPSIGGGGTPSVTPGAEENLKK